MLGPFNDESGVLIFIFFILFFAFYICNCYMHRKKKNHFISWQASILSLSILCSHLLHASLLPARYHFP